MPGLASLFQCSRRRLLPWLAACAISAAGSLQAQDCAAPAADPARLVVLANGLHTVAGTLSNFDPCHRSVSLRTPFFSDKPPLMIVVHGGGGLDAGTMSAADAFRSKGMATLVFDAFQMNGFNQGPRFFATNVTNEARQRMIFLAALGAYEWALRQDRIDNRRILFHGLSNGATVVANLAAVVDPRHVVALVAEGGPGNGIGFPDEIRAPLKMVFGRLDNYGGRTEEEFIWLRQEPCIGNSPGFDRLPRGTHASCSRFANPGDQTIKPIDWYEAQKAKGADIALWWLEDAAHGIFIGFLAKNMVTYTNGQIRFAWVGGPHATRAKFLADIEALARQPRP